MVLCHTPKAYQTQESMQKYVTDILAPYCEETRKRLENPDLPMFLIMDNCSSHNNEILSDMYRDLNIRVIWLPPHSSHFLQPLDLYLFGQLKCKYYPFPGTTQKPRWETKVVNIHRTLHDCTFPFPLRFGWQNAGISLTHIPRFEWWVYNASVEKKIKENCGPAPETERSVGRADGGFISFRRSWIHRPQ
jgi:hypothetical protein